MNDEQPLDEVTLVNVPLGMETVAAKQRAADKRGCEILPHVAVSLHDSPTRKTTRSIAQLGQTKPAHQPEFNWGYFAMVLVIAIFWSVAVLTYCHGASP